MSIETILGIKVTHLLGGAAGGTVRWILVGGSWGFGATSVLAGMLTAGYLTTPIYLGLIRYLPSWADVSTEHMIVFLVGLTGLLICQGVMTYVSRWKDNPTIPILNKFFPGQPPGGNKATAQVPTPPGQKPGNG